MGWIASCVAFLLHDNQPFLAEGLQLLKIEAPSSSVNYVEVHRTEEEGRLVCTLVAVVEDVNDAMEVG